MAPGHLAKLLENREGDQVDQVDHLRDLIAFAG